MEKTKDLPDGRYTKGRSLAGDIIFAFLRPLDIGFQWAILRQFSPPKPGEYETPLKLSVFNSILVGMAFMNAIRQVYWKLFIGEQVFTPGFAVFVSIFNTVNNGINIAMSLWPVMSNAPAQGESLFSSPTRVLGLVLFVIGSYVETAADAGRKTFKNDPRSKGKVYTGGLFGLVRHPNFAGYLLWRSGFAFFAGGLIWGAAVAELFFLYFSKTGIPELVEYLEGRVSFQTSVGWNTF
jgi:protein-S-isoprenylcysteine O-methyltransferase Ste14